MVIRLITTLNKISFIPNSTNSIIIEDYEYMKANGTSENYQNQNLKAMIVFANFLGSDTNFFDIKSRQQLVAHNCIYGSFFCDRSNRSGDGRINGYYFLSKGLVTGLRIYPEDRILK